MNTKLKNLLLRTWAAKQTREEVDREHRELQSQAVEMMRADKAGKIEVAYEDKLIIGTLVEGTTTVLDADALREQLTDEQWEAITIRKVDNDLLEAHITTGQIDGDMVERCCEIKPRSPFLRFTVKEGVAPAASVKKRPRKAAAKKGTR